MDKEDQKKLYDDLRKTYEDFKTYNDNAIAEAENRNGEATAETRAQVDKANEELTQIREKMQELETRMERANLPGARPEGDQDDPDEELRKAAFIKFIRYGAGEKAQRMMTPEEQRALGGTSDADGGFLIPPSFESGILMKAYELAELRPICQVGTTGRDEVILGALSKPTVAWGRQSIAVSQQDLTTGVERIRIYDLRALTLISNNTLDDSEADIIAEMTDGFSMALAEAEDDAFAAGAGDDNPGGVFANSSVRGNYTASGVSDALSDTSNNGVDALIGAFYTPKKTYRRNGTWAFNSTTEAVIRKLKDGSGQYLWQPPVQAGEPAQLLGKPIANPEGAPDISAGAYPIVFGDFRSGYKIRDRAGMSVQRLTERYAESDQTGFLVKKRVGGNVVLAEAFAPVKIAAS